MDYEDFNWEEMATDPDFQAWVRQPNPETEQFWSNWLARNPTRQGTMEQARWIVNNMKFDEVWTPAERLRIWQYIELKTGRVAIPRVIHFGRRNILFAAACVTLILLFSGYWQLTNKLTTTRTEYGEVRRLALTDGSVVTLNANSKIKFAKDFAEKPIREVWVEGEAFFEVAKRQNAGLKVPFVVHADNLSIEVLGTAFNVTNRRGVVDVVLQHGSVKVADQSETGNVMLMKPGEKVTLSRSKAHLIKETVDTRLYTSWRNNLLLFKEKSLTEISHLLADLYGLEIYIDNPELAHQTFTGSIRTDSVDTFFQKLEIMYPVQINREKNVIHLK